MILKWLNDFGPFITTIGLIFLGIHRWVQDRKVYETSDNGRIKALENRMDRAGTEMSDIATDVQSLPERMRQEFVTQKLFDLEISHSKEDRERLWGAIGGRHIGDRRRE